ncbi:shikimate dehydrogenase [Novosphingobium sp. 1949]|uniref:Shikimate dehydrogenase n=1 Tax=Novosphingobium organovorum TaxID=2930092 RepID=A0ABT0BIQ3_9SPHN|nr:shikimate dehydrogenase [Novosphingobium organovorum]MCJ2184728.1 shikimate dehydrogenase [Novosphingobium organovorum]
MGSITKTANRRDAAPQRSAAGTSATRTRTAGLVGRAILASQSPVIHETEAAEHGAALAYMLVDFDALGLDDAALGPTLDLLRGIGLSGVNITHPFKQQVIDLLDEVEPTARALGAVNCVRFEDGRMIGFNSDWVGFGWLLDSALPGRALACVAQMGAGGAGSATAWALLAKGTRELRLHDVSAERCEALAQRLRTHFPEADVRVVSSAAEAIAGADGVVQSTPVGMADHPGVPFDPDLLEARQWLADVIYFPRESELVRRARAAGLVAVGGEAMVVGQAADPFRRFTGLEPDRARMMEALRLRLEANETT